jgi:hypothetical protein
MNLKKVDELIEASAAWAWCASYIKKPERCAAFSAALLLPIGSKSCPEDCFCSGAGEIKKTERCAAFSAAFLLPIGSKSCSENCFCGV